METQVTILTVDGMTCGHCESRIKKVVGALNGVSDVSVDLKGKKVAVGFDPERVSLQTVKAAIEDQGYLVR